MLVFLLAVCLTLHARLETQRPLKSVNTDRPGGPIQSKSDYLPVRNSTAWSVRHTVRLIERQLIELVAGECVEVSSKRTVQSASGKTVGVFVRCDATTRRL